MLNQTLPSSIKRIYLVAICGTGMGSLAGMLKYQGYTVAGSDQNVYPPMSDQLHTQGIELFSPFTIENIRRFKPDLIIMGNAVSKSNVEAAYCIQEQIPCLSMPQAMAEFFLKDKIPLVVAGTHGKTTTTSLLAHLLNECLEPTSFFVGGVTNNFGTNFKLAAGRYFVLEGDEYDTAFFDKGPKFLHYRTQHLILTSVEFDHADIYRDLDHVVTSFQKLVSQIPAGGSIHCHGADAVIQSRLVWPAAVARSTYGEHQCDWTLSPVQAKGAGTVFTITHRSGLVREVKSPLWGTHNALNTLACVSLLHHLGIDIDRVIGALAGFKGVKRRQDVLLATPDCVIIDDFAHHPTAVQKTIDAVRAQFAHHHLIAIFEPRSNTSRRNVFQKDYTLSFDQADQVILAPVNQPTKVAEADRFNPAQIVADMNARAMHTKATAPDDLETVYKQLTTDLAKPTVLLFMSNGSFGGLPYRVAGYFKAHANQHGGHMT